MSLPRSSAGLFHSEVPIRSAASPPLCPHDRVLGACTVYAWACRHLLGIQLAPLRRGFFLGDVLRPRNQRSEPICHSRSVPHRHSSLDLAPSIAGLFLAKRFVNFPSVTLVWWGLSCGPRSTTQIPKTCPARQRRGFSLGGSADRALTRRRPTGDRRSWTSASAPKFDLVSSTDRPRFARERSASSWTRRRGANQEQSYMSARGSAISSHRGPRRGN
jgi:hypothetical protein